MDIKTTFVQWKEQCMTKVDFSKKGSVDEDILDIVNFINASENYYTTSSCSGRIILIDGVTNCSEVQKQNCSWLFVTHQKCQNTDVVAGLEKSRGDAVFKFEPFVLHVQCRQLEDAQLLHSVAINSGFRNSGITVGKKGKIIMAVRSTHCLEVPLSREGRSLVNADYIDFLVEIANQKMEENLRRIQRFYDCLQSTMHPGEAHQDFPGVTKEKLVYRRRRKRTQDIPRADSCHQSVEIDTLTNGDDGFDFGLELFT